MPAGILSDGQMDLSPDNEPSAPPRDGVHLFVLVHGLAGKNGWFLIPLYTPFASTDQLIVIPASLLSGNFLT